MALRRDGLYDVVKPYSSNALDSHKLARSTQPILWIPKITNVICVLVTYRHKVTYRHGNIFLHDCFTDRFGSFVSARMLCESAIM